MKCTVFWLNEPLVLLMGYIEGVFGSVLDFGVGVTCLMNINGVLGGALIVIESQRSLFCRLWGQMCQNRNQRPSLQILHRSRQEVQTHYTVHHDPTVLQQSSYACTIMDNHYWVVHSHLHFH